MVSSRSALQSLLLVLIASNASARVCDLSLGPETFFISVSSQEELDTKLGNCTTILGSIFIEGNYTGSLRLDNVTEIDGRIFSSTSTSYVPPASLITSIEFPNLKTVGSIQVSNAPSIDFVSFPILSKADMIYLGEIGKANVSFPSLITAGSLTISGNTTSLNFPLLKSVRGQVIVTKDMDEPAWGATYLKIHHRLREPINISFPALQNASGVRLQGNIASLSLPKLSTMTKHESPNEQGVTIGTFGDRLDISLPSLNDSKFLELSGTIGIASFPLLLSVQTFAFDTFYPRDVDLAPLKIISHRLQLSGNITSISMATVTNMSSTFIESELNLDCSVFEADLKNANRASSFGQDTCTSTTSGTRQNMIPMMGLGIGFVVSALLALV